MTIARSRQIDAANPGWIHCISRCVRRAFLCGDGLDHRKQWVEDRLRMLSRCFAIEIAGYAIMSNHFHVIVRPRPDLAAGWNSEESARRWLAVYPQEYLSDGAPIAASEELIALRANDWAWVATRRKRLGNLGWFMKALKETIARRANREDGCTGAFWEGRFRSVTLLNQAALIGCMAYVDLNPIRADLCDRPEHAEHTSVHQRIRHRQRVRAQKRSSSRSKQPTTHTTDGAWLTPLPSCRASARSRTLTLDQYLALVDATGRILRLGTRGAIPHKLPPIIARLDIELASWTETMRQPRQMYGSAIGSPTERRAEAARRGTRWLQNRCRLFGRGDVA